MKTNKRIVIFGATGTIGTQALSCLEDLELVGITYYKNIDKAKQIISKYNNLFSLCLDDNVTDKTIIEFLNQTKPDIVLNAISGWDGLRISKLVLEQNIDLALANKESYVIGNKLFLDTIKKSKAKVYPVDSEHSSLYELLLVDYSNIDTIYITASGGPFFDKQLDELKDVDFQTAIKHPNWSMGEQISLDSATMINKFYELVEAAYLTNFEINIVPIVHRQSMVHSFVKYKNNSYLMNASVADMKLSIDLAIHAFNKQKSIVNELDFSNLVWTFQTIDENRFIPIKWFNEFFTTKNYSIPVIVNIVNEYCFKKFKNNEISFLDITNIIDKTINEFKHIKLNSWEDLKSFKTQILKHLG